MKVFETVFDRDNVYEVSFKDFLYNTDTILEYFNTPKEIFSDIRSFTAKKDRNECKREHLPAGCTTDDSILSIDIDSIRGDEYKIKEIYNKLKGDDDLLAIQKTVSNGLVLYYRFNCSFEEYPFLYYKKYLELTLRLSVNIDFLPDFTRLRYVSDGEVLHYNEFADTLTEILDVGFLPSINTVVDKENARRTVYGSR